MSDDDLKKAQSWTELVLFVECPFCGKSHELGAGTFVGKNETMNCDCGREFIILPPEGE